MEKKLARNWATSSSLDDGTPVLKPSCKTDDLNCDDFKRASYPGTARRHGFSNTYSAVLVLNPSNPNFSVNRIKARLDDHKDLPSPTMILSQHQCTRPDEAEA